MFATTMDLAAIPRDLPQFGKSLKNLMRPADEVFGSQEEKGGSCGCSGGECGCGGSCGGACGCAGRVPASDSEYAEAWTAYDADDEMSSDSSANAIARSYLKGIVSNVQEVLHAAELAAIDTASEFISSREIVGVSLERVIAVARLGTADAEKLREVIATSWNGVTLHLPQKIREEVLQALGGPGDGPAFSLWPGWVLGYPDKNCEPTLHKFSTPENPLYYCKDIGICFKGFRGRCQMIPDEKTKSQGCMCMPPGWQRPKFEEQEQPEFRPVPSPSPSPSPSPRPIPEQPEEPPRPWKPDPVVVTCVVAVLLIGLALWLAGPWAVAAAAARVLRPV